MQVQEAPQDSRVRDSRELDPEIHRPMGGDYSLPDGGEVLDGILAGELEVPEPGVQAEAAGTEDDELGTEEDHPEQDPVPLLL